MVTSSFGARPNLTTLLRQGWSLYRMIQPSLAGGAMLGASSLPWLVDPLGKAFPAWQLPVDIGWQLRSDLFSYGLLCLCCAGYAFFVAYLAWQVRDERGDWTGGQGLVGKGLAPFLSPQTHSTLAGLLCLMLIGLFFTQYLFIDMGSIAQLAQHEFQALFIQSHFGYHTTAQLIPMRPDTLNPSTFNGRFALLLNQLQPGLCLPLLAAFCLLKGQARTKRQKPSQHSDKRRLASVGTGQAQGAVPTATVQGAFKGRYLEGGVVPSVGTAPCACPPTGGAYGPNRQQCATPSGQAQGTVPTERAHAPMDYQIPIHERVREGETHADQTGHDVSPPHAFGQGLVGKRTGASPVPTAPFLSLRVMQASRRKRRCMVATTVFVLLLAALGRGPAALACRFQAEHLLTTGEYVRALIWLDRASKLNPSLEQLAEYHIARGQAWYYLHPTQPSIESQAYLAAFYLTQNDYLSAYQRLLAARQQSTATPAWLTAQLSITLTRLAEMQHPLSGTPTQRAYKDLPSITWLKTLIHTDPNNVYAHYTLGRIAYDIHDFTACEKQMLSVMALSADPNILSSVYTYLSLSSEAQGNYVKAREYLFKAQDLDPAYRNNTAREEMSGLH